MNRSQKRIIRIAVIAVLVIAAAIFALIRMNIRPADDYKDKLSGVISEAEGAISTASLSQDEMNADEVKALVTALGEAKTIASKKNASNDEMKSAFLKLTDALGAFNSYSGLSAQATSASNASRASSLAAPSSAASPSSQASSAEQPSSSSAAQPSSEARQEPSSSVEPSSEEQRSSEAQRERQNSEESSQAEEENNEGTRGGSGGTRGGSGGNRGGNSENDSDKIKCTITIVCTNLVGYDGLDASKKQYVPSGGVILKKTTVSVDKGSSAYDVTKKICSSKSIHLASKFTPAYDSYYVEGINHLFEFDGGPMSGWIYKVNGSAPNYGCSKYEVKNGDDILWGYTVNGVDDV